MCYECNLGFSRELELQEHIASHYSVEPAPSTSLYCEECRVSFSSRAELKKHEDSHYRPDPPEKKLKCALCQEKFEDMPRLMKHMTASHKDGKAAKRDTYFCGLCKKGFEARSKLDKHEKLAHKHECDHCHKKYTLEVDLKQHMARAHKQKLRTQPEGFNCGMCNSVFSDLKEFRMHQAGGHGEPCHVSLCNDRFNTKQELQEHLRSQHAVVHQMNMDGGVSAYLTTVRSQENIDIAEWAEDWIQSQAAVQHMVKVMAGNGPTSKRNALFLDRRERERCSGSETSRLYQLSNPGFLGGGGEADTAVIRQLIDKVFHPNISSAHPDLQALVAKKPEETAFVYASCVLFPETFIFQHQVQGKTREEAEMAFMEMAVDPEEKVGLKKEIGEAAARRRGQEDPDSGDEWVDHSDMEDDPE